MVPKDIILHVSAFQMSDMKSENTGLERFAIPKLSDIHTTHALIISGIRRCGKSTLMAQMIKKSANAFYLNFDDLRLADFTYKDFALLDEIISAEKYKVLFFDEIQIVKNWELYVKQKLSEKFKVIVTGSNASLLSKELGTRLTGRHFTRELFPFSYSEFIKFKSLKTGAVSFQKYLEAGGFPEYVKTGKKEYLTQLFSDILNRDIIVRHGVRDVSSLKRLSVFLMSNIGNLISATKLQQSFSVKTPTILEYFSYLEDTYLINFMPKFSYSLKAQAVNPKKVYAIDSALQNTVSTNWTDNNGRRLENVIYWHLRRENKEIYYFSENGKECDFIICENDNPKEIIQVCYELNAENRDRETAGLKAAMDFFKISNAKIITYNQDDAYIQDGKRISVIPVWKYITQKWKIKIFQKMGHRRF